MIALFYALTIALSLHAVIPDLAAAVEPQRSDVPTPTRAGQRAPAVPLGLDINGAEFALVANKSWAVHGGGHAKEVQLIRKAVPGATGRFDRQDQAYIWAKTCTRAKQVIVFAREYFLSGPVKGWAAEFYETSNIGAAGDRAISRVRLFVNGKLIKSFNGGRFNISEPRGTLFKHGTNRIEVHVEKRAVSGDLGRCAYGSPPKPLGIYFQIYGSFQADLWYTDDRAAKTRYVRVKNESLGISTAFVFRPRNLGPSGAYTGQFTVDITSSGIQRGTVVNLTSAGSGLEECQKSKLILPIQISCKVNRMPRGAEEKVRFEVLVEFVQPLHAATVALDMLFTSPTRDPDSNNNGASRIAVQFCGPTNLDPRCPPP